MSLLLLKCSWARCCSDSREGERPWLENGGAQQQWDLQQLPLLQQHQIRGTKVWTKHRQLPQTERWASEFCCFTKYMPGLTLTGLAGVQQVCILLVPDGSAPQRGAAVAFASQARTPAARQGAWGPAEGAGAAGAAPAAWRETETLALAHTPALPHQEKVKTPQKR